MDEDDPFVRSAGEEEKASLEEKDYDAQETRAGPARQAGYHLHGRPSSAVRASRTLNRLLETTARAACKPTPEELRERKASRTAASVKLPVCGSILIDMKTRMWTGRGWTGADMRDRMTYNGCRWAFEMGARVSENTTPEPGGSTTAFEWMT